MVMKTKEVVRTIGGLVVVWRAFGLVSCQLRPIPPQQLPRYDTHSDPTERPSMHYFQRLRSILIQSLRSVLCPSFLLDNNPTFTPWRWSLASVGRSLGHSEHYYDSLRKFGGASKNCLGFAESGGGRRGGV